MSPKRSAITTHILDLSLGKPADDVLVQLARQTAKEWQVISEKKTNSDGRVEDLMEVGAQLTPGNYRLHFITKDYFTRLKTKAFYPFIDIVFTVEAGREHYHVPLLLSPFGFSSYRGS